MYTDSACTYFLRMWVAVVERMCVDIYAFFSFRNPATALQSYLPGGWRDFDLRDESYLSIKPHALTIQQHLRAKATSLWIDLLPRLLDSDLSQGNRTSTHVPTLSELIG